MAARAALEIAGTDGQTRRVELVDFYRLPGSTPHLDTNLRPGDIVIAILVPQSPANARATYVKVRDRQSYAYALTSVACGLDVQGGIIHDARLAAGGVGTKPWRLDTVEAALRGKPANATTFTDAAKHAADGAQPHSQNAFKIALLQNTVRRALHEVA